MCFQWTCQYVLWATTRVKAGWRYGWAVNGGRSVTATGMNTMHTWSARSWDLKGSWFGYVRHGTHSALNLIAAGSSSGHDGDSLIIAVGKPTAATQISYINVCSGGVVYLFIARRR